MLTHQAVDIPEAVFLAMVPRNQDQVLAGAMDFYLVNHTPYFLYFGLMVNKSGHFQGIASGRIEPSSRHHLGKVERTEIEDWNHSLLQPSSTRTGRQSHGSLSTAISCLNQLRFIRKRVLRSASYCTKRHIW